MKNRKAAAAAINPRIALIFLGALSLAALVPFAAKAADAHGEIVTAATHADLAAGAADVNGVHMHLQHAVNCLVGPDGAGYDAKQMNPCANSGKGAIVDSTDPKTKDALAAAVKTAEDGIGQSDLAKAKQAASATAADLKAVQ